MEAASYSFGYLCILMLHEAAHALVARALGLKVMLVQVSGEGGLCQIETPKRLWHSVAIYSAGIVAEIFLLVTACGYLLFFGAPGSTFGRALLSSFIYLNAFLIAINLIPHKSSSGHATDGMVLWQLLRHRVWGHPHPHIGLDIKPDDESRVFSPKTCLLTIAELVPAGFHHGVEILNDRTTPMAFVVIPNTTKNRYYIIISY